MNTSSYINYLPPVLWSTDTDPGQLLPRMLRIFEKILTGIDVEAYIVKANAAIVNAANNKIQVISDSEAAKFRSGDTITIQGTAERVSISQINKIEIMLDKDLLGVYNSGTIRLADLVPGQMSFRVSSGKRLGPGSIIRIIQDNDEEIVTVKNVENDLVILNAGLTKGFSLADSSVNVRIKDGISINHGDHSHESFEKMIDELSYLFNPWRTRKDLLPSLASWVALTLKSEWSECQQRKLISAMASIYQMRGLKQGLFKYLDIYDVAKARPRITIDDGEAVFRVKFSDDNTTASLHALAFSNAIVINQKPITSLLHPIALAVDINDNYIIPCDGDSNLNINISIWKVSRTGELEYKPTSPPELKPIYLRDPSNPNQIQIGNPVAAVVDSQNRYCIVDSKKDYPAIYCFDPNYVASTIIDRTTLNFVKEIDPVDMILDNLGKFIILDARKKLIVVSENPISVATYDLASVVRKPTALVMDSSGRFIVADASDQSSVVPAGLVRIDPGDNWKITPLVIAAHNPLVYPTGLVFESPNSLLVLDTGVREGTTAGDPTYRVIAKPAALYRVDFSTATLRVTKITDEIKMVYPTKMKMDSKGNIIITDHGEKSETNANISWRTKPHEFGVNVLFSKQDAPNLDVDERNQIRRGVIKLIEEHKTANTHWWFDWY